MTSTASGWAVLSDERPLLVREYSIGPGNFTNVLVAGIGDGELLVMSPSSRPSDEELRELEAFGRVAALVAPNPFHHSGLSPWHAAFPDAGVFAASGALSRLTRRVPEVPIQPVAELVPRLGPGVLTHDPPGMRFGETWLLVEGDRPTVYVGDAFLNLAEVPWFPIGWMLRAVGLGPGFRANPFRKRFLVTDKEAHRAWLDDLMRAGPVRMVPGHGDVLEAPDLADQLRSLFG